MKHIKAPRLGKPILPSLFQEQVLVLMDSTPYLRNKAIIALATESGLRLSELICYAKGAMKARIAL